VEKRVCPHLFRHSDAGRCVESIAEDGVWWVKKEDLEEPV